MSLDPQFLEILACPDSHHAPLDYDAVAQTLTCTQCRRVFEIRDGIPVLLLDQARNPGGSVLADGSGETGAPQTGAPQTGAPASDTIGAASDRTETSASDPTGVPASDSSGASAAGSPVDPRAGAAEEPR